MKIYRLAQNQKDKENANQTVLPRASEIISILRSHPLIGNIGRIKSVYAVGSFAKGDI